MVHPAHATGDLELGTRFIQVTIWLFAQIPAHYWNQCEATLFRLFRLWCESVFYHICEVDVDIREER